MVENDIQKVLADHLKLPNQTYRKFAKEAQVSHESLRRLLRGIGNAQLSTTNALLVATGHTLKVVPIEEKQ